MRSRGDRSSERGVAAILVVGTFVGLLLIVGMSSDFGILLRYRRAMQNACDAGAMAGAGDLRSSPGTAAATAVRYSENDMRQNAINWDPSRLSATVLPYGEHDARQVRVEIHADVPLFFLSVVRDSVHVAVDCMARLTPVILSRGLVPLGLNYSAWAPLYDPTTGAPCASYIQDGVPLEDRPEPCDSFGITIPVSSHGDFWGPGNSGMLAMSSDRDCFDDCPVSAREWEEAFVEGSMQAYCYDASHTATVGDYSLNGDGCAVVRTRPGTVTGPVRQAVDARCDSDNPLDRIIIMPLLNPTPEATDQQGSFTTEIWGFTAFELDCANRPRPGAGTVIIRGGFVSIVSYQATGTATDFDTGVYTIRLVE
ncbi:MAG: Tad domain-containing protein [Armatimonadota bacterium]|nr:Tad domain-containing protein [Armatimonadota bacterium]